MTEELMKNHCLIKKAKFFVRTMILIISSLLTYLGLIHRANPSYPMGLIEVSYYSLANN